MPRHGGQLGPDEQAPTGAHAHSPGAVAGQQVRRADGRRDARGWMRDRPAPRPTARLEPPRPWSLPTEWRRDGGKRRAGRNSSPVMTVAKPLDPPSACRRTPLGMRAGQAQRAPRTPDGGRGNPRSASPPRASRPPGPSGECRAGCAWRCGGPCVANRHGRTGRGRRATVAYGASAHPCRAPTMPAGENGPSPPSPQPTARSRPSNRPSNASRASPAMPSPDDPSASTGPVRAHRPGRAGSRCPQSTAIHAAPHRRTPSSTHIVPGKDHGSVRPWVIKIRARHLDRDPPSAQACRATGPGPRRGSAA